MSRQRLRLRTRWGIGIRVSDLKSTSKYVALMLQTWADENGERARPSYPTLAEGTGLDRSTIARHVKTLRDAGWLNVQGHRGRNQSNRYTLTIPAMYEALIEQTLGPDNVSLGRPFEADNVSPETVKRLTGDAKRSHWEDPSLPKPSKKPLLKEGDLTPDEAKAAIEWIEWERKAQRRKVVSE